MEQLPAVATVRLTSPRSWRLPRSRLSALARREARQGFPRSAFKIRRVVVAGLGRGAVRAGTGAQQPLCPWLERDACPFLPALRRSIRGGRADLEPDARD